MCFESNTSEPRLFGDFNLPLITPTTADRHTVTGQLFTSRCFWCFLAGGSDGEHMLGMTNQSLRLPQLHKKKTANVKNLFVL